MIALAGHARAADDPVGPLRRLLGELVAADTTNPPGNEARAVAILERRLRAAGIPSEATEFAPGRKNLVARLRGDGSARPLLLLAHIDVVGTDGQSWTSPPHRLTEKDGFLVGRGVSDDFAMAALHVETLAWLARSKTKLRRDVIVAFTGDEESGGAGLRWLLEHRPASIDAEIALNEGGGLRLDEDGRPSFVGLQAAEKTYQDFALVAAGPSGHSAVPLADNAIDRLAAALDRLGRHRFPVRLLPVVRDHFRARAAVEQGALAAALAKAAAAEGELAPDVLSALEANPVIAAMLRTTCVATTLAGGSRVNALPAEARANLNCRILPDESIDSVRRVLEGVVADPKVAIEPGPPFGGGPAASLEGAVPEAIRTVLAKAWPGIPLVPQLSLGTTDSRFLRAHGVAAYGFSPVAMRESDARRAHGVDERVPIASLGPAIEIERALVLALAAR